MVSIQYWEKRGKGLRYKKCEPPFNYNYSSMPRSNTSVDDLVLQSNHALEFPSKLVSLTVDPMFVSDDSEEEEITVGRSADYSTSSSKSQFVPNTDFIGCFGTIKMRPNEMFKNFKTTFITIGDDVKNKYVLESGSSPLKQVNRAHSTITKEAGSKLIPNCEPYVPTRSLEQDSTSTSLGQGDCDVKPFDPKDFHDKTDWPSCLDSGQALLVISALRFQNPNQKITPKAKTVSKPMRIDQSSKPKVMPQKRTQTPSTTKRAK
ncbi:hypothetical protein R6Q57_019705 [Mikania cordata]